MRTREKLMLIDRFVYLMNQFIYSLSSDLQTVHVYIVDEHYVPRLYMYLSMTAYCLRFEISDFSSAIGPLGHFISADLQRVPWLTYILKISQSN